MMTPRQDERILIASGDPDDSMRIWDANPWLDVSAIEQVKASGEAVERLSAPDHRYTLLLVDRDLAPDPAQALISFVRRDPSSPFPGLAVGLIGSGIQPIDLRRAVQAGCILSLSRPFNGDSLGVAVRRWPLDRSDFMVTGAYVGPDRRRVSEAATADRRQSAQAIEQAVASTASLYDIAPETTAFRFKRLAEPATGVSPAMALRNGLRRDTVAPAVAHIGLKKKEGLALLDTRAGAMTSTWRHLQTTLAPKLLTRLNGQATESSALASQRGLLLLAAITRSLATYSAGRHRLGPRLVAFLRAHLEGVGTALRHRIDDDGGPVGRKIMATLKDAERRFVAPEGVGEPDFLVTARQYRRPPEAASPAT